MILLFWIQSRSKPLKKKNYLDSLYNWLDNHSDLIIKNITLFVIVLCEKHIIKKNINNIIMDIYFV